MAIENRRSPRNKTYAKVLVQGDNVPGYLRDLSREGCQLALLRSVPARKGDALTVSVLPGEEIGIDTFSISLRVMWNRSDPVYCIIGAEICAAADQEHQRRLERLFDYYG